MSSPKCLLLIRSTIGASRVVSEDPSFINILKKLYFYKPYDMNWFLAYSSHVYINITTYPVEITTFLLIFGTLISRITQRGWLPLKGGGLPLFPAHWSRLLLLKGAAIELDEGKFCRPKDCDFPKGADAVQKKR